MKYITCAVVFLAACGPCFAGSMCSVVGTWTTNNGDVQAMFSTNRRGVAKVPAFCGKPYEVVVTKLKGAAWDLKGAARESLHCPMFKADLTLNAACDRATGTVFIGGKTFHDTFVKSHMLDPVRPPAAVALNRDLK